MRNVKEKNLIAVISKVQPNIPAYDALRRIFQEIFKNFQLSNNTTDQQEQKILLNKFNNLQKALSTNSEWEGLMKPRSDNRWATEALEAKVKLMTDVLSAIESKYTTKSKYQISDMNIKTLITLTNDLIEISPQNYKTVIDHFMVVDKKTGHVTMPKNILITEEGKKFIDDIAKGNVNREVIDALRVNGLKISQIMELHDHVNDKINKVKDDQSSELKIISDLSRNTNIEQLIIKHSFITAELASTKEGMKFIKNHLENIKLTDAINNAISAKFGVNEHRGGEKNKDFVKLANDLFEIISENATEQDLENISAKSIAPIIDVFVRTKPMEILTPETKKMLSFEPSACNFVQTCIKNSELASNVTRLLRPLNLPPFDDFIKMHHEILKVAEKSNKGLGDEDISKVIKLLEVKKTKTYVNYAVDRLQNSVVTQQVDKVLNKNFHIGTEKGFDSNNYVKVSKQLIDYANNLSLIHERSPNDVKKIVEVLAKELIIGSREKIHIDPKKLHIYSTETGKEYIKQKSGLKEDVVGKIDHMLSNYKLSNEKRIALFCEIAQKGYIGTNTEEKYMTAIKQVLDNSTTDYFIFRSFNAKQALEKIKSLSAFLPEVPVGLPPSLSIVTEPQITIKKEIIKDEPAPEERIVLSDTPPTVNNVENDLTKSVPDDTTIIKQPASNIPPPPKEVPKIKAQANKSELVTEEKTKPSVGGSTNLLEQINQGTRLRKTEKVNVETPEVRKTGNPIADSLLNNNMVQYRDQIEGKEDPDIKTIIDLSWDPNDLDSHLEKNYQDTNKQIEIFKKILTREVSEELTYAQDWLVKKIGDKDIIKTLITSFLNLEVKSEENKKGGDEVKNILKWVENNKDIHRSLFDALLNYSNSDPNHDKKQNLLHAQDWLAEKLGIKPLLEIWRIEGGKEGVKEFLTNSYPNKADMRSVKEKIEQFDRTGLNNQQKLQLDNAKDYFEMKLNEEQGITRN